MIRQQPEQHEEGVGVGEERVTTAETLIPGLPDDIALLCIAGLPLQAHGLASTVSRAWRRALQSEHMWRLRRTRSHTQHLLCFFSGDPGLTQAEIFEPSTCTWTRLPLMPSHPQGSGFGLSNIGAVGLGPSVYVLGGCPHRPYAEPCTTLFGFDCRSGRWERRQSMRHPRWRFACTAFPSTSAGEADQEEEVGVIVAAGGSTSMFPWEPRARTRAVEVYDVARDEWRSAPDLPEERVGATAFFLAYPHPHAVADHPRLHHPHPHPDADHPHHHGGREWDFWIMGGNRSQYPYIDGAVLSSVSTSGCPSGGWHLTPPPTWHPDCENANANDSSDDLRPVVNVRHERELPAGRVAVIHGRRSHETSAAAASASASGVYALCCLSLYRYDIAYNRWEKESNLPQRNLQDVTYSLVALNDELYVVPGNSFPNYHSTQASTRERITMVFQVYNPWKQSWRSISTERPIKGPLKLPWIAMCSVEL